MTLSPLLCTNHHIDTKILDARVFVFDVLDIEDVTLYHVFGPSAFFPAHT